MRQYSFTYCPTPLLYLYLLRPASLYFFYKKHNIQAILHSISAGKWPVIKPQKLRSAAEQYKHKKQGLYFLVIHFIIHSSRVSSMTPMLLGHHAAQVGNLGNDVVQAVSEPHLRQWENAQSNQQWNRLLQNTAPAPVFYQGDALR